MTYMSSNSTQLLKFCVHIEFDLLPRTPASNLLVELTKQIHGKMKLIWTELKGRESAVAFDTRCHVKCVFDPKRAFNKLPDQKAYPIHWA